jgi:hypothetical protein
MFIFGLPGSGSMDSIENLIPAMIKKFSIASPDLLIPVPLNKKNTETKNALSRLLIFFYLGAEVVFGNFEH